MHEKQLFHHWISTFIYTYLNDGFHQSERCIREMKFIIKQAFEYRHISYFTCKKICKYLCFRASRMSKLLISSHQNNIDLWLILYLFLYKKRKKKTRINFASTVLSVRISFVYVTSFYWCACNFCINNNCWKNNTFCLKYVLIYVHVYNEIRASKRAYIKYITKQSYTERT